MSDVTITLPDGSTRSVAAGTSVRDLCHRNFSASGQGRTRGCCRRPSRGSGVPPRRGREGPVDHLGQSGRLTIYRHSTAHLLAAAVTNLFPGVQCGIGPAIDEGFFYDFVVPRPFVPEDLEAIEQKMREMAQQDLPYERQMWPREEARRFFGSRGEPLKVQLIDEKTEGQAEVSCYTIKDRETFVDFCVGPHVPSTGRLKAFKLLSTSNAYWKGDARNQPMQRIYGTAFFADKDLQAYLHRLEEAEEARPPQDWPRSEAVHVPPWAPGATFWLGKGTIVYNTLADLHARGAGPGRLRGSEGAHRVQQGALGDLRTLAALPAEHVSRRERRRADGAQGDELPRPLPDVCERGAELSRSADPFP